MRYLTADLHLNHPFVAGIRGFWKRNADIPSYVKDLASVIAFRESIGKETFNELVDVKRHNQTIINHINNTVSKTDELYIAGDLSKGNARDMADAVETYVSQIQVRPTHIYLITGNHDGFHPGFWVKHPMLNQYVGNISNTLFLDLEEIPTVISHTPRRQYMTGEIRPNVSQNALDTKLQKYAPLIPEGILHLYGHTHTPEPDEFHDKTSINVGLDAWNLYPVSETDILTLYRKMQASK